MIQYHLLASTGSCSAHAHTYKFKIYNIQNINIMYKLYAKYIKMLFLNDR